jgi:hypothetical protein
MLFEEEDLFMFLDERSTPAQWECANLHLNRPLSVDAEDQHLWNVLLEETKQSASTQISLEEHHSEA